MHQNEPGVLVYRITRGSVSEDGSQDIRMIEQYVLHISSVLLLRNYRRNCFVLIPSPSQAGMDGAGRRLIDEDRYKDQEAFDHHSKTESFETLVRSLKDEDVLAKPFELLFGNPAGGFVRT